MGILDGNEDTEWSFGDFQSTQKKCEGISLAYFEPCNFHSHTPISLNGFMLMSKKVLIMNPN